MIIYGLPTTATSNNQKLGSAGEIDTRCRKINKTLTDLYYDIIPRAERGWRPRVAIYDLVCPRAQASSSFGYTFDRILIYGDAQHTPVMQKFYPRLLPLLSHKQDQNFTILTPPK